MKTKEKARYIFTADNDGHDYVIPLADKEEFDQLLEEAGNTDDHDAFNEKFGDMRVGWGVSFTDPRDNEGNLLFPDTE